MQKQLREKTLYSTERIMGTKVINGKTYVRKAYGRRYEPINKPNQK